MRSFIFAVVILSTGLAHAEQSRVTLWPGASSFTLSDPLSTGGVAQLGLSYKLTRWLEPEVDVGLGLTNLDYLNRFSFGFRLNLPVDDIRPFAWLAFSHFHEAPLGIFISDPLGVAFGLSESGVAHRSGAEGGLGLTFDFQTLPVEGAPVLQVTMRGTALWLPAAASFVEKGPQRGTHVYALFEVMVGLPFDLSPLVGELG